jgi:hypothetical protein
MPKRRRAKSPIAVQDALKFNARSQESLAAIGADAPPVYPKLRLNKLKKFKAYLSAFKENIILTSAKDIEQVRILEEKMTKIENHIFTLMTLRTIAYALLYASVISSFVAGFSWLREFTLGITLFSSVLGSGVLVVIILILNHAIDSHFSDLHLMASHLIAIYVKHEDEWRPRILEFIEQSF